jgi:ABC-2 type transport system ATP-binding protein
LRFPEPRRAPPAMAGALAWEGDGAEWAAVCTGALDELKSAVEACGAEVVDRRVPSLDEIFVARVGTRCVEPVKE